MNAIVKNSALNEIYVILIDPMLNQQQQLQKFRFLYKRLELLRFTTPFAVASVRIPMM